MSDIDNTTTTTSNEKSTSVMEVCGLGGEVISSHVEAVTYHNSSDTMTGRRPIGRKNPAQLCRSRRGRARGSSGHGQERSVVEEVEVEDGNGEVEVVEVEEGGDRAIEDTESKRVNNSNDNDSGRRSRGGGRGGQGGRGGGRGGKGGKRNNDKAFQCHWQVENKDRERYGSIVIDLVKMGEWYLRSAESWGTITEEEAQMRRVVEEWESEYGRLDSSPGRLGRGRYRPGGQYIVGPGGE